MLLRYYHHLHSLSQIESFFFVDNIDENNNLNVFEIVASTSELVKELVNCY
jgi:hypothetical protein